jgi:hypothetical protein
MQYVGIVQVVEECHFGCQHYTDKKHRPVISVPIELKPSFTNSKHFFMCLAHQMTGKIALSENSTSACE